MPKRKWNHQIHKYTQVVFNNKRGGTTILWRCTLPNCQHYLVGEMVVGKLCLCNRCNEEVFEMRPAHLDLKKPHCLACTKHYKDRAKKRGRADISIIAANLEELLKVN